MLFRRLKWSLSLPRSWISGNKTTSQTLSLRTLVVSLICCTEFSRDTKLSLNFGDTKHNYLDTQIGNTSKRSLCEEILCIILMLHLIWLMKMGGGVGWLRLTEREKRKPKENPYETGRRRARSPLTFFQFERSSLNTNPKFIARPLKALKTSNLLSNNIKLLKIWFWYSLARWVH